MENILRTIWVYYEGKYNEYVRYDMNIYGETLEEYCKDKNKIFNNKYYCFFFMYNGGYTRPKYISRKSK